MTLSCRPVCSQLADIAFCTLGCCLYFVLIVCTSSYLNANAQYRPGLQVAIQKPGTTNRKQYKYDKVFGPDSNQEQVYEDTKALIRSVLDGAPEASTTTAMPHLCCICSSSAWFSTWSLKQLTSSCHPVYFCIKSEACQIAAADWSFVR